MLCYNIRCLYKSDRRRIFSNFLLVNAVDIVCISETWLTDDIAEGELFIPQYQCFLSNRKAKSGTTAHVGTMICVKNEINSEKVKLNLEDNGSVTACLICLCKKKILIVCCYLPPSNSTYAYTNADIENLFKCLQKIKNNFDELIIYGDFNFPTINWTSLSSAVEQENIFLDIIDRYCLQQKISFQTAATGILDLILVGKKHTDSEY